MPTPLAPAAGAASSRVRPSHFPPAALPRRACSDRRTADGRSASRLTARRSRSARPRAWSGAAVIARRHQARLSWEAGSMTRPRRDGITAARAVEVVRKRRAVRARRTAARPILGRTWRPRSPDWLEARICRTALVLRVAPEAEAGTRADRTLLVLLLPGARLVAPGASTTGPSGGDGLSGTPPLSAECRARCGGFRLGRWSAASRMTRAALRRLGHRTRGDLRGPMPKTSRPGKARLAGRPRSPRTSVSPGHTTTRRPSA